jgi:hypothetical protein
MCQTSHEQEHARGFMDNTMPSKYPPLLDYHNILQRLPQLDFDGVIVRLCRRNHSLIHMADFYSSLQPLAAYGPRFQRVLRCHGGPLEAIAEIEGLTPEEL